MEDIQKIAQEVYEEGFFNSEAYPIIRWRKRGYPEEAVIFKAVDAYIRFMRAVEEYQNLDKEII